MPEPDKQQVGEGQDNLGQAVQKTAEAAQQISSKSAETASAAGKEAVSNAAAATVQASLEGGKAAAEVAAGTAAGGPWGAVLSAVWASRHTLWKIIICIALLLCFFIVAIVSLPSIVANNIFRTDPDNVDYWDSDIYEIMDELSAAIAECVELGYDHALAEVERIIADGGYDYELSMEALINNGFASADYDICYILAAYSASLGQRGTNRDDMVNKLNAVADRMFPVTYEEKSIERVVPLTYPTYSYVAVRVVTSKVQSGSITNYTIGTRYYYTPSGEETTTETITRSAYHAQSVEIPVYSGGVVTGSTSATYYTRSGTETLVPDTEIVYYAECTIHNFNTDVILEAFGIDPDAIYDQFNITYAEAIEFMANSLKRTIYGSITAGDIPAITDAELLEFLNNLDCSGARKALIQASLSLVGRVPYFWGGKSAAGWNDEWNTPKLVTSAGSASSGTIRPYGLDCSGFTDWVYKTALGHSIGAGTSAQWGNSVEISYSELLPGDLAFKASSSATGAANHVMIYAGKDSSGNDLWIHCASSSGVVMNSASGLTNHYRRVTGIDLESDIAAGPGVGGSAGVVDYTLRVNVTHYCPCALCCGANADGITASGKTAAPGMVAMSSYYAFGTKLSINGTVYTVEDRGGSGIENDITRVDIFVNSHQEALRLGRYWTEATFYK